MKNLRHWCPSLWGRLSKWSNISNWKSRICFRQCIGIRTISLLLGLLRQSGIRPSWQTWFSVLCWTSSFYGNRGMPRGGSERVSWQVDHAVWTLYGIDVEQVSCMSLKLSSAKRVETGVHHLPDYLLSCSWAAVLDSLRGEMTAILIFVRLGGMWQCDAECREMTARSLWPWWVA